MPVARIVKPWYLNRSPMTRGSTVRPSNAIGRT